jgi:hypothetical protein
MELTDKRLESELRWYRHYHALYVDDRGQRREIIAASVEDAADYICTWFDLAPSVYRELCLYHHATLIRAGGVRAVASVLACSGPCYESKQGRA